mmetsp:Transcript_53990/g.139461  ORF Transcript_53990/g.139461 Transcript_53990/m.139461 type:complete len:84 (-) Transcript_53990:615-866(-)
MRVRHVPSLHADSVNMFACSAVAQAGLSPLVHWPLATGDHKLLGAAVCLKRSRRGVTASALAQEPQLENLLQCSRGVLLQAKH